MCLRPLGYPIVANVDPFLVEYWLISFWLRVRLSRSVQLVSTDGILSSFPFDLITVYTLKHRPQGLQKKYLYTINVNNQVLMNDQNIGVFIATCPV